MAARSTKSGTSKKPARDPKPARDVEKDYSAKQFVAKLRRLADCIEQGKRFRIQVAGERVLVPADATISVEHERGATEEELELQLKWNPADTAAPAVAAAPAKRRAARRTPKRKA